MDYKWVTSGLQDDNKLVMSGQQMGYEWLRSVLGVGYECVYIFFSFVAKYNPQTRIYSVSPVSRIFVEADLYSAFFKKEAFSLACQGKPPSENFIF